MAINLMLVDDHSMIREGFKKLLESDGDIKVIAEASNGEECIRSLNEIHPDLLLLDISMPNMNGLEVLQYLKDNKIEVKKIVLTVHNEVEYLIKAVEIGIDGYVLKESEYKELRKAIFSVMEGDTYIEPCLVTSLNKKIVEKNFEKQKMNNLTNRELEVLKLVAMGLFNKEIGEKLKISERTVKNHVSNIFRKIDVADRTQAAIFAIRNNLINIF